MGFAEPTGSSWKWTGGLSLQIRSDRPTTGGRGISQTSVRLILRLDVLRLAIVRTLTLCLLSLRNDKLTDPHRTRRSTTAASPLRRAVFCAQLQIGIWRTCREERKKFCSLNSTELAHAASARTRIPIAVGQLQRSHHRTPVARRICCDPHSFECASHAAQEEQVDDYEANLYKRSQEIHAF